MKYAQQRHRGTEPLTRPQLRVLQVLQGIEAERVGGKSNYTSTGEVSRQLYGRGGLRGQGGRVSNASKLLNNLAAVGLVQCVRPNRTPVHEQWTLTDKGRERLN